MGVTLFSYRRYTRANARQVVFRNDFFPRGDDRDAARRGAAVRISQRQRLGTVDGSPKMQREIARVAPRDSRVAVPRLRENTLDA